MEIMNKLYKDPKTGKIYHQVGGQEPVEIDESFAKILNLDIDSIPVLQKEEDYEKVICPNCGNTVRKGSFCSECGASFSNEPKSEPIIEQKIEFFPSHNLNIHIPGEVISEVSSQEESQPVDDTGLTFLGEFCKKTMATVGGDGYDEIVLYKNEIDDSFQIHTYLKYEYMPKESHHSFKAKDGAYEALLKLVDKLQLDQYEGKTGIGLCGGMYICKYNKDGVIHVVTTDNFGGEGSSIIIQVGNLISSFKGKEITKK